MEKKQVNPERASILIDIADRASHDFINKYDPKIRALYADFFASDDEDNIVVFHQREMVTIAALMSCGVDPRLAAALVGENIIPLAEPVAEGGDFETEDGAHWRLTIELPSSIAIDPSPYLLWAFDQEGHPHDLDELNPTQKTIAANRLPADLPAMIEARAVVRKALDL